MTPLPFLWTPGRGFDPAARARLRAAFPRPAEPMGEAWFMGETRRTYPELMGDLGKLSNSHIDEILQELVRGPTFHGVVEEYLVWHHYLLGEVLPRMHDHYSPLCVFITGVYALYPDGIPDAALRRDLLDTLGKSLMEADCWPEGRLDPDRCLMQSVEHPNDLSYWNEPGRPLNASMFFVLKHLSPDEVGPWLKSVLAIPDPHWQAQLIAWLAAAHHILAGLGRKPADLTGRDGDALYWDESNLLVEVLLQWGSGAWLPPAANLHAAMIAIREALTPTVLADWRRSIAKLGYLDEPLGDLPERVLELYGEAG